MADTKALPTRSATVKTTSTTDDAVPEVDPTSTAGLLAERLQAWKHAVGYLEDYMEAVEKIHKAQSKEYERALKVISHPLKEGHHFDQSLGGIAGYFENMRSNTQAIINTNLETEKSIKGSVLPVLERLHKEIKHKGKELAHGAQKSAKEVEKARNTTQKHIELLGQQTAAFESAGGKMHGSDDPYVVHRGVLHRLHKQVLEENNNRNDLIAVQNNFEAFEAHVIEVIQQSMEAFVQLTGGQAEKTRALYSDMLGAVQRVPPDLEWKGFVNRSGERLVNPNDAPRSVESVTFPNMDHSGVKPLIEGSLERKSRNKLSWGYSTGYYVVTPAKFLHEFKDSDNTRADPKPDLSIYLPDAVIGQPNGDKFNVKGKDKSGSMSAKLTGSAELAFKAHTPADAEKWFEIIKNVAGATGPAAPDSAPTSPAMASDEKFAAVSPTVNTQAGAHQGQEAGVTGADPTASPEILSPVDGPSSGAAIPATKTPPVEEKKA
ncbi:Cytoskeletal signaling protein slm1 [Colletotrichum tropicale]|nr:Cytoskeletal signaling protein slm1 [Colletotrichum tropicale]KAI8255309.1 Cytoskeletal signaling protein slm1 [Colletotrichum sp. SAR11_239]KAI8284006.1 Cytoskeletal signaling protein slm1 [Colletotrichum sp. SAR 10_98]